jgi:hypothetical protein
MQVQNNLSVSTLTSKTNSTKDSTKFQEALKHFDELYQQSQVSGVSTYLFTKALEGIGLHKGDDLKGIELLRQHHFNTSAPSINAILKYGNIQQTSGNHSYMKEQAIEQKPKDTEKDTEKPSKIDETPIAQDIKKIDKKLKIDVSNAKNYFDVAKKLDTTISAEDRHLNINQILSLDKYTIPTNSIQTQTPLTLLLKMSDETKE